MNGGKKIPVDPNGPLVTVIIVTYNAARHLQSCLDSVNNNSIKDIEVLVFDGASTDDTISILKKNEAGISYWQSEPDKGIYDAMNKAVEKATGKWILILGSDDTLLHSFSEIIPFLKDERCIYYGDYISDGKRYGGRFSSYRLSKANFCQQNILYAREVFRKYHFDLKYPISADHLLNMQCWADKDFRFEYRPIPLVDFSSQGISSRNIDTSLEKDRSAFIKKYLGYPVYLRYCIRLLKNKLKRIINK